MTRLAVSLAVLVVAFAPARAEVNPLRFDMVKVADGIYAAIQSDPLANPVDGNSIVIVNDSDVVVVDARLTPAQARAVIAEIRKLTDKPVRYVVNTHWHDDHVLGNQAYAEAYPGVEFVGHPNTRLDYESTVVPALAANIVEYPKLLAGLEDRLARGVRRDGKPMTADDRKLAADLIGAFKAFIPEMKEIRPTPQTLLVEKELTIRRGERIIRILHLGRGNTRGDLVVHLPNERILITGDLLVNPVPFSFGSYLGEWIETLGRARALDAKTIVPGHGPVQHDAAYLDAVVELLRSTLAQTKAAAARGLSLEETRKAIDLEPFRVRFAGDDPVRSRAFADFFVEPAVERAYKEAKGEL
jgi:cyclase